MIILLFITIYLATGGLRLQSAAEGGELVRTRSQRHTETSGSAAAESLQRIVRS